MRKQLILILLLFLFLQPVFSSVIKADQENHSNNKNDSTPFIDYSRGFKIDFNPPDPILDCGSFFFLNVTLTRCRLRPTIFSLSVFLNLKNELEKDKVIRIGLIPFIYIPPLHNDPYTIQVPCFTTNQLASNLYCLKSKTKNQLQINPASIGVKIDRVAHIGLQGFLWYSLVNKGLSINNPTFVTNHPRLWNTFQIIQSSILHFPINKLRFFSFFQILNSVVKTRNPFITWEDTNVISPFPCTKDIDLTIDDIRNETDKQGRFNLTRSVTNNLNRDISTLILVDVSDKPLANSLAPMKWEEHYNVGYKVTNIQKGSTLSTNISCQFPKMSFKRQNYSLTVECAPYLPIQGSNQFGIYTYDYRWQFLLKPTYTVNDTVTKSIQNMWYNIPILYGEPNDNTQLFPTKHSTIQYNGDSPEDAVVQALNKINRSVEDWFQLYFFYTLILIGCAIFGYWIVRKTI